MSLRPLQLPAFRRLLVAYSVNQLGDWAAEISLAVIVFAATHSPAAVAATWVVHRCAFALLAPLLVARLEGYRADRLLPAIYGIEAALFMGVAFAAPVAGLPVVLALVAVDGLLATTARALARSTLVSVTRPAGMHREGNALINVVFTVNGMIAPVLGGVLVAAMGAPAALTVNAASFLIAAGALAGCPPMQSPVADPAAGSAIARLRDALHYVSRRALLRGLLGGDAALAVFVAMITPVEIAFVTDTLHSGSTALGAVLTAWGVGMVAGGALAGRLRTAPLPALLLSAGAAEGAACLGMGLSWTLVPVLAFSALGGVGNGIYGLAIVTAIQERTSDVYQTRINGLYDTLMTIAPGLGFAVGGVLATLTGPRTAYLVAGAGAFAVVAWSVATLHLADWSVCSEDALTCSADSEPRTAVSVAA